MLSFRNILRKRKFLNYINIPSLSFLITFALCVLILTLSSIYELSDYSSTIGFSSKEFNYNAFIDGLFYKQTLDFYTNWKFFNIFERNFISGPVVPFLLVKLSFENLKILFILFSIMISTSVTIWSKIICKLFTKNYIRLFLILIIIINPYNYYFVLKPGSEIPFQLFFAAFNLFFLSSFHFYEGYLSKKNSSLINFRFCFYSTFIITLLLLLTRPTALMIVFCLFIFISFLLIRNSQKIRPIRHELLIVNSIFFALLIYFSFLYFEYANLGLSWLDGDPEAIATFSTINQTTYFGLSENYIRSNLEDFPIIIKQIFTILWRISNWILGICGIRDSFSFASEGLNSDIRMMQIILRISYGIFMYLPILLINLFFGISTVIDKFIQIKFLNLNSSMNFINLISISIIMPNIIFYSNERYIFMIFPALLISSTYFISKNFVIKNSY